MRSYSSNVDGYGYGTNPDFMFDGSQGIDDSVLFLAFNLELFIPLLLIFGLNLFLFIRIKCGQNINCAAWRWLVTNTSFCMMVMPFISYNKVVPATYHVKSLMSTKACPTMIIIGQVCWNVGIISSTLVIIERFHALRRKRENEGYFYNTAAKITLASLWIIVILGTILPRLFDDSEPSAFIQRQYSLLCLTANHKIQPMVQSIIMLFAVPTFIVVLIGTLLLRCQESSTETMKKSIADPLLKVTIFGLIFLVCPLLFRISHVFFPFNGSGVTHTVYFSVSMLLFIYDMAFPIIWLCAWRQMASFPVLVQGNDATSSRALVV